MCTLEHICKNTQTRLYTPILQTLHTHTHTHTAQSAELLVWPFHMAAISTISFVGRISFSVWVTIIVPRKCFICHSS